MGDHDLGTKETAGPTGRAQRKARVEQTVVEERLFPILANHFPRSCTRLVQS